MKIDNLFDKSLHHLGKTHKDVLVLNIGAMDGVMFDEMIGYTKMYDFTGLYVEPIPYLFNKLKKNLSANNYFENSAISDFEGEIQMLTIDKEVIDQGLVHSCFYGMSSVYPPKNGLGSEFDRPTVEKYGKMVTVPCITFDTLVKKHNIEQFDVVKIDAEGHDYIIFKQIKLDVYKPKVVRIEWINLSIEEQESIIEVFEKNNYVFEITGQDIVGISKGLYVELTSDVLLPASNQKGDITLVTGLWDIGRGDLQVGWNRNFQHYLDKFEELLKVDYNLIIFGDKNLEEFVSKRRSPNNTQFILRDISWFRNNEFFEKIQKIRNDSYWYSQSNWLPESTQAKLEMYNPLVMSKMFLLHDAKILDKFNSSHMFWIDGGLTNTVHHGYFTHDLVIGKIKDLTNKFLFVCFPYDGKVEIHGFEYKKMCEYSGSEVDMVARGGFFGGTKESISNLNSLYYSLMSETLSKGLMGTEESLFTILTYRHGDQIDFCKINNDGLINTFFENLKNGSAITLSNESKVKSKPTLRLINTAFYVITFNSPKQFETLLRSIVKYDSNFLTKNKKFLLDNSSDLSTTEKYKDLCDKHGFEHIKKDNLGICGGRQFIAEHADKNDFDGYWFSEDDMFFQPTKGEVCRNGFPRYVENFHDKCLEIVSKEGFDFLKINFSEFYGDNSTQWSWYNVPQEVRVKFWPDKPKLPVQGLDPNAPRTIFTNIKSHMGIPYATGEIYYCNWTHFVTKEGNKKMFLDTKWAHPFENTWMSFMYQEMKKGVLNPGILLMTPIEHNRFEHYEAGLRKEN